MNKTELKHQVKDLYKVLNEYIEHSPSIVESVLKLARHSFHVNRSLNNKINAREIKRKKLIDEFIRIHKPFDIHEALNIDIKEARKKLKNFDFTVKEKNIILNRFCGGAESFLKEYNRGVIN